QTGPAMNVRKATERGLVQTTELEGVKIVLRHGHTPISRMEDHHVAKVRVTTGDQRIILATKLSMAICFNESDVRPMGRNTRGVRGISLAEGDSVIGSDVLEPDCQVLTVSEEGFGKRNNMDAYQIQLRGGKGVKNFKITPKTGAIVGVEVVHDNQELMLITSNGILIRTDIESIGIQTGRTTS
ncbi:DNA gyrase C-terminal beta-propeller domain-containing protein, partial [Megasphaera stantonii]|uniref:DNA gyrase C-terminal beta-propeller domain-containing protein n=1 Tax=Megasphaera stantonii TaxID=2144175 RepID=UPI002F260FFB